MLWNITEIFLTRLENSSCLKLRNYMNQINKIQDYLRLNYPTLWNLKIVHALTLGLLGNLIVFTLGYISTYINQEVEPFSNRYHYYSDGPGMLYFFSFILALLAFIVWLVFYFRNNRVKRFYPITTKKLYVEWFLSFLIVSSFCLFPLSVKLGSMAKQRSYMSEQEVNEGLTLLNKVAVLDPSQSGYLSDSVMMKNIRNADIYQYGTLLGYSELESHLEIKRMLVNEDSIGIRKLMEEYILFQKKHVSRSELNADLWMDVIYHPPHYIVNRQSKQTENLSEKLSVNSIRYMYREVQDGYDYEDIPVMSLIALFFGLSISMTIFACRATSGKSWLIALVVHFVVMLVTALLVFMVESFIGYLLMWILIYALYILLVWVYTTNNRNKGKTPILMNLIITYSAVLLLFIFGIVFGIADEIRDCHYDSDAGLSYCTNDGLYNFLNEWKMYFFWATLLLTIPLMYLITKWTLKWKALPEE